jgi:DNA-binding SARP family transcriptional activator
MYRLNLLGGVSMDGSDGPVTGRAAQRHRLALLGILAAALSPGVSRDRLVDYLWPERSATRARHALADSIYRLNEALGGSAVLAVGDQLRLNGTIIRSDVGIFRNAIAADAWDDAVRAYSGPFMDGFFLPGALEFERWLELVRERLEGEYAQALESLAAQRSAVGDAAGAVAAWRQRALLDRYDSRVALGLMEALVAAGNRTAALRHAHFHTRLLHEELGTPPIPEIATFTERLVGGRKQRAESRKQ